MDTNKWNYARYQGRIAGYRNGGKEVEDSFPLCYVFKGGALLDRLADIACACKYEKDARDICDALNLVDTLAKLKPIVTSV